MRRVLVIGAGYFARFHLAGWQAAGAQVVGLCDLDDARAAALGADFGVGKVGKDAAAMMDALAPDLIDVVLPPSAQAAVVKSCLTRGLPTICQKPFGLDLARAEGLAHAAAVAGVPLVVHENFRFAPWFREARRLIDAGALGRVHGVSFRLRPGDGQGLHAYLDRQPYFQTMPQLLVRETAVHFIDSFRFLCGEVRAVTARLRRLNPVIAGEDAGTVLLEFDDDRQGLFDGNRLNMHPAADQRRTMGEMWLEGERRRPAPGRRGAALVDAARRRRDTAPVPQRRRCIRRCRHRPASACAGTSAERHAAREQRVRLSGQPACSGSRLSIPPGRAPHRDGRLRPPRHEGDPIMNRLTLLAAVSLAMALPAAAQTVLKFSHTDQQSGARQAAAQVFAKKVEELTQGRYKVNVFCCSQLGNDPKNIEQLALGGIDFTVSATGSYAPHVPSLNLTMMPFLVDSYAQGWKLYDESKWLRAQFAKAPEKGFRFLSTWEAGFRSMTTKEPLNKPSDATGKKLRTFPNEMMRWTLEAMGFNIQIMPLPEVYLAIQQGAVSGQENPIDTIYSNKFYEVAPNVTLTNHVYSPIPLTISEKTWQKLSPADQQAVMEAARISAKFSRDMISGNDAKQLAEMAAKGAKINAKPDVAAFRAAVQPVYTKAREKYGADVDAFLKDAETVRKAVK
jgi:tripartite ATP-independent transporter DctP family solute receptor